MADYVQFNIPMHRSYWVYRMWAADDTCLYVGRTTSWVRRFAGHFDARRNRKEGRPRETWYEEIVRVDIAEFSDKTAAAEEELAQIRELMPRENRHLKGKYVYGVGRVKQGLSQSQRDRYQADPGMRERINRQSLAWREANRERFNEIARNSWHKRRAEISDEERQRRLELHNAASRRYKQKMREQAS